ncbi:MAG: 4Fe-4S dicluster domain-containing protein [Epsilonproteobacteria bacterium]|nr:4Fe-4S dicluster domain-containing protein [Campylobacterota bacterium]
MSNEQNNRRDFLKQLSALGVLGGVIAAGVGGASYLGADQSLMLRPPAAVDEDEFLALCVKCGQCLQVCPYDSIILADVQSGHSVGTPFIDPLRRGCYLCPLLPCVLACPTGALDHHVEDVKAVEMGIAITPRMHACIAIENKSVTKEMVNRIYDHTKTLTDSELQSYTLEVFANKSDKRELEEKVLQKLETFVDKACTLCADMCPLPNATDAIHMVADEKGGQKPEILSACVGCGVCVEVCPTSVLAIKPRVTYDEYYEKG